MKSRAQTHAQEHAEGPSWDEHDERVNVGVGCAVFWDLESFPIPSKQRNLDFADALADVVRKKRFGSTVEVSQISVYIDEQKSSGAPARLLSSRVKSTPSRAEGSQKVA